MELPDGPLRRRRAERNRRREYRARSRRGGRVAASTKVTGQQGGETDTQPLPHAETVRKSGMTRLTPASADEETFDRMVPGTRGKWLSERR
jgi:hypothetical protein